MFALSISLSDETLATLKPDLNRWLPAVKSSHRCEALARALGFEKYASLLTAVANGKTAIRRQVEGAPFTSYLRARGFVVAEAPLWKGVARAELERIRQAETRLTVWGLGPGEWARQADGTEETTSQRRARFAAERAALTSEGSLLPFLTSMAMLAQVPKTKTVRPKAWSYWLKHIAENMQTTFPDGSGLGPIYVPNGLLVAAALASGFEAYHHVGQDRLSVNASFNMPYATLVELDIVARPDGARAQARRRKQEERELTARFRQRLPPMCSGTVGPPTVLSGNASITSIMTCLKGTDWASPKQLLASRWPFRAGRRASRRLEWVANEITVQAILADQSEAKSREPFCYGWVLGMRVGD